MEEKPWSRDANKILDGREESGEKGSDGRKWEDNMFVFLKSTLEVASNLR